MIDMREAYNVGALLYSPALNMNIASSIIDGKFGQEHYSVALCLEDTIAEAAVRHALEQLRGTFKEIYQSTKAVENTLPKLFVRVRNPEQILQVYKMISPYSEIFSGFILPKYSSETANAYNIEFKKALDKSSNTFYMMPILESKDIVDFRTRKEVLSVIKQHIDCMKEYVLNVRVGGNDFCSAFGVRRHIDETIYDILPVSQLLCDILTAFSQEYVVSGPVWEYFSGANESWAEGLRRELKYDMLNGFVGKTVIHPNQIAIVTEALKVSRKDFEDASEIMTWPADRELLVCGSREKERMNEINTHYKWAQKTLLLADMYGVAAQ